MDKLTHIGLDVHNETIAVAVLRPGSVICDERVVPNTSEEAARDPVRAREEIKADRRIARRVKHNLRRRRPQVGLPSGRQDTFVRHPRRLGPQQPAGEHEKRSADGQERSRSTLTRWLDVELVNPFLETLRARSDLVREVLNSSRELAVLLRAPIAFKLDHVEEIVRSIPEPRDGSGQIHVIGGRVPREDSS
jgi:hypothetical protein